MMRALFVSAAFAMTALSSAPAMADPVKELETEGVRIYKLLPRPSTLIAQPGAEGWEIYGVDAKAKTVRELPGDTARVIRVAKPGANAWDIGANMKTGLPTEAGDVLLAAVWARAAKLPRGESSVSLPLYIQQQGGDYETFQTSNAQVTGEWELHYVHATLPRAFRQEEVGASMHFATGKHTIELGPAYLMNLGPGAVEPSTLPGAEPAVEIGPSGNPMHSPTAASPVPELSGGVARDYDALAAKLPASARRIAPMDFDRAEVFGGDFEQRRVSDRGVPGGEAIEITVQKPGLNSWSTGVNWPILQPIEKGDSVVVAFWAKGIDAQNESQTPAISPVRVQQSGGDYESAAGGAAFLSRDWKQYFVTGTSGVDIAPGPAGVSFHMGSTAQTLRLGPVHVVNLGKNVSLKDLPVNEITYSGRDASVPWRKAAMHRIDANRRAELRVRVLDAGGAPVAGEAVRVRQLEHAFRLGSFTNHRYGAPKTSDERSAQKIFDESFNMLTLSTYWQDWGWNGPGSKEQDYRESIAFAHKQGMPWRAHPIMWPGENYMPTWLLETPKDKQRKAVMDHVREVMEYVAKYDPVAIDMVNEVRVNRYFRDRGQGDIVEEAWRLAHSIAPDVPLFVNDYGILNNGGLNSEAIDYYHGWLREMRGKGLPIGGIGFQGHFSAGLTAPERVVEILQGFEQYGLPLQITEFDIETLDESAQADYTRDFMIAALSVPLVDAFVFWGFWEGDHWKRDAAMIREDWTPKPAYTAFRDLIYRDLWTDTTVTTDADGYAVLRPMKGTFEISAGGTTQSVEVSRPTEVSLSR